MPQDIEITLNGEAVQVVENQTVAGLLASLQLHQDRIAVELNRQIVRKRDWESTLVHPGSRLEVVEFVGGG